MKSKFQSTNEIEVIDEHNGLYARIRVRERGEKTSIFLTPDQLEEHARECLALVESMRNRR